MTWEEIIEAVENAEPSSPDLSEELENKLILLIIAAHKKVIKLRLNRSDIIEAFYLDSLTDSGEFKKGGEQNAND